MNLNKKISKEEATILQNMFDVYMRTVGKLGDGELQTSDLYNLFLILNHLFLEQPIPQGHKQVLLEASKSYKEQLPLILQQENIELQIEKEIEDGTSEETMSEYSSFIKNLGKLIQPEEETEEVEYETETE